LSRCLVNKRLPAPWYQWDGEDLILSVHIQPKASRDTLDGTYGERLKIRITAAPVDGKANEHLVRFLASLFDVPRRQVELLSGASGRAKRIRIQQPRALPAEIKNAWQG
jgi:uncharacterized protein (TIGR00251 family)